MDEELKPTATQEENPLDNEELKDAIEAKLRQIQTQNLLLGAQVVCQTVLDKIYAFERALGSKSTNDYKRLMKDIKRFCEVGVSRKVNPDGTTEPINKDAEETAQNQWRYKDND